MDPDIALKWVMVSYLAIAPIGVLVMSVVLIIEVIKTWLDERKWKK